MPYFSHILYYSHMLYYCIYSIYKLLPHAVLAEQVLVALLPGQGQAGLAHTALPEYTTVREVLFRKSLISTNSKIIGMEKFRTAKMDHSYANKFVLLL